MAKNKPHPNPRPRSAVVRGVEARNALAMQYVPLVRKWVAAFRRTFEWLESDDTFATGFIGLLQAAERWDPERDVKFITYASQAIKHEIARSLTREGWRRETARPVSRDENNEPDLDVRALDFDGPDWDAEDITPAAAVELLLRDLRPRWRAVVEMRFGLGRPALKLAQIAKELGVSAGRPQQILSAALEELWEAASEEWEYDGVTIARKADAAATRNRHNVSAVPG